MKQYASIDDTVYFWFASNDTSGSGDDGAAPAADVRLAGAAAAAAPMYSPVPVLLSDAGYPPGAYEVAITASVANGFAADNTYAVFCTLAVDAQNPTGFVGSFDTMPVQANAIEIESADPTDTIRDSIVDDANRIDASALNILSGHDPGANIAKAGDAMDLIADAIKAVSYDETTAWPVKAADTGATQIARVGADGDTLETLSDQIDGVPTTGELDARTLLAADYFDFTSDSVVVGTNNDKIGYALSNVGADLILKTSTFALALADAVWDEILTGATHNIATSAGRRLRELGAYHISSGTAQAGAAYSITLAAGEPITDHLYNRNLLVILAGTGTGQTRTIVDYDGTTKIAVVDRNWWINPDATSEYTIIPDDTPLVADHGIAIASTNNTITLRPQASAISSTYSGNIIQIMAGTGAGQSRVIDSYDGATKIATICMTWTTNPDNTSVYVLLPYGVSQICKISPGPLADIRTQADDALTAVHLDDLIQLALTVNDGAPNAADFITSSAVAINDWYNQNMLLFTSGALAGLSRYIDDYDGATKRIYLSEAFPQAPANTDDFVIVGISGSAPTSAAIADAVWDELEAGHVLAGSFGEEVTKQGKKLDRNLILDL